jgi:hypothetical protein
MFSHPLIHAEIIRQRQRDLERDAARHHLLTPLVEHRGPTAARRRIVGATLAALAAAGLALSATQAWGANSRSQSARIDTISPTLTYRDISRFVVLQLRGETYTHARGFNCWAVAGKDQRWALNVCVEGPGVPADG